jgi:hypothetical protein
MELLMAFLVVVEGHATTAVAEFDGGVQCLQAKVTQASRLAQTEQMGKGLAKKGGVHGRALSTGAFRGLSG